MLNEKIPVECRVITMHSVHLYECQPGWNNSVVFFRFLLSASNKYENSSVLVESRGFYTVSCKRQMTMSGMQIKHGIMSFIQRNGIRT